MDLTGPKPLIDDDNRVFWEGMKEYKLMLQHCDDCQKYIFYPRIICPHCYSEKTTWKETSGQGEIVSYTIVRRAMPPFKEQTPYVVALIQLDEGVRMISRITNNPDEVKIGNRVSVVYEQMNQELTLPFFQITNDLFV